MDGFDYYEGVLDAEKFATAFETLTDYGLFDGAIFDFDNDVCKGDGVPIHQDWKGNKYFN